MIRWHRVMLGTLFLVGLSAAPAHACTPVMSVANGAVLLAYFLWLVMALVLSNEHPFAARDLKTWTAWVPAGLMVMAVPMFAALFFPFSLILVAAPIMVIAFPMHLAVEFFAALFERPPQRDRTLRLVYNGLPLALVIGLGITAKLLFYGRYGGLRALLWNYAYAAELTAFGVWVVVGIIVLVKHHADNRPLSDA